MTGVTHDDDTDPKFTYEYDAKGRAAVVTDMLLNIWEVHMITNEELFRQVLSPILIPQGYILTPDGFCRMDPETCIVQRVNWSYLESEEKYYFGIGSDTPNNDPAHGGVLSSRLYDYKVLVSIFPSLFLRDTNSEENQHAQDFTEQLNEFADCLKSDLGKMMLDVHSHKQFRTMHETVINTYHGNRIFWWTDKPDDFAQMVSNWRDIELYELMGLVEVYLADGEQGVLDALPRFITQVKAAVERYKTLIDTIKKDGTPEQKEKLPEYREYMSMEKSYLSLAAEIKRNVWDFLLDLADQEKSMREIRDYFARYRTL